jgi:hypothetical protein
MFSKKGKETIEVVREATCGNVKKRQTLFWKLLVTAER